MCFVLGLRPFSNKFKKKYKGVGKGMLAENVGVQLIALGWHASLVVREPRCYIHNYACMGLSIIKR